jgi:hypothetical protein
VIHPGFDKLSLSATQLDLGAQMEKPLQPMLMKLAAGLIPALLAGVMLGKATVADLRPILPPAPPIPAAPSEMIDDAYAAAATDHPRADTWQLAGYGEAMVDCTDCSDYALGYRWAELSGVHDPAACMTDSWSFQRGCIAFVRGMPRPSA